jgi:hypothetical protein
MESQEGVLVDIVLTLASSFEDFVFQFVGESSYSFSRISEGANEESKHAANSSDRSG